MKIYSVYDKGVTAFLTPFFARARGEALRMFTDAVLDKNSPFIRHKADYCLYELGEFNELSGRLEVTTEHPARVLEALEVVVTD